jgi:hypothetical protein
MIVEDIYEEMMAAVRSVLPDLDVTEYDELGDEVFLRLQRLRNKDK